MKNFFLEYWLYILVPFVLLTVFFAVLWIMAGGEGGFGDFTYNVF